MSKGLQVFPPSFAVSQATGRPRSSESSVAGVRARMPIASSSKKGRRVRSISADMSPAYRGGCSAAHFLVILQPWPKIVTYELAAVSEDAIGVLAVAR